MKAKRWILLSLVDFCINLKLCWDQTLPICCKIGRICMNIVEAWSMVRQAYSVLLHLFVRCHFFSFWIIVAQGCRGVARLFKMRGQQGGLRRWWPGLKMALHRPLPWTKCRLLLGGKQMGEAELLSGGGSCPLSPWLCPCRVVCLIFWGAP